MLRAACTAQLCLLAACTHRRLLGRWLDQALFQLQEVKLYTLDQEKESKKVADMRAAGADSHDIAHAVRPLPAQQRWPPGATAAGGCFQAAQSHVNTVDGLWLFARRTRKFLCIKQRAAETVAASLGDSPWCRLQLS